MQKMPLYLVLQVLWQQGMRTLSLSLEPGSRMLPPLRRDLSVKLGETMRPAVFEGRPLEIRL